MFNFYKPNSRWLRRFSAASLFVLVGSIWSHAATYYSRPTATNFAATASWSSNTNGIGGTSPASISNADDFVIQNGSNMVLNASAAVRTLTMNAGRLTITANTLTISLASGNTSTLNLATGSIFDLQGGSVVLNGNMVVAAGASLFQSGGTFSVDGNDNGNAGTSVPSGTPIVLWQTDAVLRLRLTGGTFSIVDPHVGTALGTDWAFNYNAATTVACGLGHTFQIGNGVSTQATTNTGGFIVEMYQGSGRCIFGNFVVNTTTAAGNRHVSNGTSFSNQTLGVLGNMTINAGSEYRAYCYGTANAPDNVAVGGNFTNNGTFIMPGTFVIGSSSAVGTTQPSNVAQTIGGTGTFQNGHASFSATFQPIDANYVNLTINNGSAGGVTFATANSVNSGGYGGTLRGTLTFTRGEVVASIAPFILGINATTLGTLTYTAGGFRSGTTFGRWYGAATGGATFTAGADLTLGLGRYPFAQNNLDKSFFVRQNTVPTTGGTISVLFTNANTQSAAAIVDGAYTIDYRHDANWTVTSSGITGSAQYHLGARLPGAFSSLNGNVRLCLAAAPAQGAHQNGVNIPTAQRINIPFADLANTYYMGVANADQAFVSVASGNYNTGSTWNKDPLVPTATDAVTIGAGTTVTINDPQTNAGTLVAQGGTLTLAAGGNLTVAGTGANLVVSGTFNGNAGTASIGSLPGTGVVLNAGGVFNVAGATINLGPQDNSFCSRLFTQNGGTLNVSSGNLNIAGRYVTVAALNPKLIQTGGAIRVDGNAGGVAANSIGSGLAHFDLNVGSNSDVQLSGGSITIVDPHANATASNTFLYTCLEPNETPTTVGHSFFFGDGVSNDAGGNATNQFRVVARASAGFFKFCNLVVQTGSGGANRAVTLGTSIAMYRNLTINSGSTWNAGSGQQLITGNFIVDGTAIMSATFQNSEILHPTTTFGPTNVATTIGGTGTIQNLAAGPTAMLTGIYLDNTHPSGLTLNRPVSMSGSLNMIRGIINTTTANLLSHNVGAQNVFIGSNSAGYINGPFERRIPTGLAFNSTFITFPVGKTGINWMTLNPNTVGAAGITTIRVEAFDANAGTNGTGITVLNSGRRWQTAIQGTNNLVQYGWTAYDPNMESGNALAHSTTAAGAYDAFGGSALYGAATSILPPTLASGVTEPGANFREFVGFGQTGPLDVSNVLATQQTGTTSPGTTNVSVIRYGVVVSGATGSVTLTDMDWEYTGNNAADIAVNGVTLWTGTLAAPVTQVAAVSLSGGFASFTGLSIPMTSGNNFLWVRVNVNGAATIGNTIDGRLPSGNMTFSTSGGATATPPLPSTTLDPGGNILIDYCTPTYGSGCGSGDEITNVSLGALSNASGCAPSPYYTFFNAVTKPALTLGNAYTVNVTMGTDGNQYSAVWIDFDKSGTFDATEYFTLGTNAGAGGTSAIPITVPGGASLGDTRMRVRGGNDSPFAGFGQACGASSSGFGETEDYIVTIVSPAPRSIDPIAVLQVTGGMARSTNNNNLLRVEIPVAGSTGSHTLSSLQMTYTGTNAATDIAANGVSLWLGTSSAPTSQIGSSVSIVGGLANFTGLSAALNPGSNYFWIRVNTTAGAGIGNIVDGSIVTGDIVINNVPPAVAAGTQPPADLNPAGNRFIDYCPATYANGGGTDNIANVVLNGETINLTNASGQSPAPAYYTFFNAVNKPDLFQGSTYSISITFGSDGTQYSGVWVDFNTNGVFEASEFFSPALPAGSGGTSTFNIVVPPGASLGDTRMRIRGGDDALVTSGMPCGASGSVWGETEDYIVTIIAPPNCSTVGSWPATATTASAVTVCSGDIITFGLTVAMPSATGITYQWRRNGVNLGAPTITATTSIPVTLAGNYDVVVRCNGTPVVTATAIALTVNSPTVSSSTPATTCGPNSVTLSAVGTGTQLRWYNAPTGGSLVSVGGTFVTPVITSTTPYYVAAANLFGTESGGRPALVTPGSFLFNGYGVQFTAASDMVLNSTVVYPTGTGDFIVALYNSSGVELAATPSIPVVGGTGTPQVVNLNFDVAAGVNYRLLIKSFSGITGMEREFVGGFPYASPSGAFAVTAGWNGAATNGAYYYFYNISVSRLCTSNPRTLVNATYAVPPSLSVIASPPAICQGQTSNISANGAGYTSYVWTGGPFSPAGPGGLKVANPGVTTTYAVTATGGGCTNAGSVTVVVNPTPTVPVINTVVPAGGICINAPGTKTFNVSSSPNGTVTVFNEGFNNAGSLGTWTLTKGGTVTPVPTPPIPPIADWTLQLTPWTYSTAITNFSVSSPASGFVYVNSDELSTGGSTFTGTFAAMASPSFSTVGYTGMVLTFRHVYRSAAAGTGSVQYSTDGGTSWSANVYAVSTTTPAQVWNAANIQTVEQTVNLPAACNNQPNLRLRFRYDYGWDWFWMLDDINVTGTPVVQYQWSSSFAFAGIPVPAQSFAASNNNMVAQPTQGGAITYVVTARNANGCVASSTASHSTNVSDIIITPSNSSPQRENTNLVISTTATGGFGGYSYQWTKLPSPTVISTSTSFNFSPATVANSGTYQLTVTDGQGCSVVGQTEALVYAAIVWNGSQGSNWNNPLNWTPPIVPANDCAENVVITNSGTAPIFPGPTQNVGNFGVENNGVLTLNSNLNVCGSLSGGNQFNGTIVGTGTISLTGAGTQLVGGRLSTERLIINKPGGQVNFSGRTNITDLMTISNNNAIVNVTSSGRVVLRSTPTGTGKIGPVPAGTTITVNSPGGFVQERYLNMVSNVGQWYFLGSPMENQNFTDWSDNFSVTGLSSGFGSQGGGILPSIEPERSTIFKYVEALHPVYVDTVQKHGWRIPGAVETIGTGVGYRVFVKRYGFNQVFDNKGLINFGTRNMTLTRSTAIPDCQYGITASTIAPCTEGARGWNLLANTYPCPVDWDAVGWTKPAGMQNAIYTWNSNLGGYRAYIGSGVNYPAGVDLGYATITGNASPNIIPSSQGYMVKVSSGAGGTLTVTEAAKSTTNNGTFSRSASNSGLMTIKLTSPTMGDAKFTGAIKLDPAATDGFDENLDFDAISGNSVSGFSFVSQSGNNLWLNAVSIPSETKVIPMFMTYNGNSGSFTFSYNQVGAFYGDVTMYLRDTYLGTLNEIVSGETYSFDVNSADASSSVNRFEIVISPNNVTGVIGSVDGVGFEIYPNPTTGSSKVTLEVNGAMGSEASIVIVDVVGKVVYTNSMVIDQSEKTTKKSLNLPLAAGLYTVKLISTGKTFTSKLVIR